MIEPLEDSMKVYIRIITLLGCFIFLNVNIIMAQYETPKSFEKTDQFPWMDGKRCAVSLTFDDARHSQIDTAIPLLNEYGVKATFYVSPVPMLERADEWIAAVTTGHEIGNHTMTHPCTGNFSFSRDRALENFTLERIAQEMDRANDLILDKLNVTVVSFAYPCGQQFVGRGENLQSYVPVVSKKFLTGRGWLGEATNDPWFCDLSNLLGMESDGKSFEELKILIDRAAKESRWLILAGHEVGDGGRQTTLSSSLERLCQYAQNPDNGIWIDTVGSVAEYIQKVRDRTNR